MVGLTFVIGVLNVCLGYALAVYLGYEPPGLAESWRALTAGSPDRAQPKAAGEVLEQLSGDLAVRAAENVEEPVKP